MNEGSGYKTSEFWAFLVKLTMQKNSCTPASEGQTKQLRKNNKTRTFELFYYYSTPDPGWLLVKCML